MIRSDIRLTERALAEGWPVTAAQRQEAIRTCVEIMRTSKSTRNRLAAVRCLLAADNVNQRQKPEQYSTAENEAAYQAVYESLDEDEREILEQAEHIFIHAKERLGGAAAITLAEMNHRLELILNECDTPTLERIREVADREGWQ